MRPSCGLRRSAMSSFASTFRRVVTPTALRFGIRWVSWSTPSMRKRTTRTVRLRLEVDVARLVLGCLEENGVHQSDERGVGDAVLDLEVVGFLVDHLQVDRVGQSRSAAASEGLGRAHEPTELDLDLLARGDTQSDRVAARET